MEHQCCANCIYSRYDENCDDYECANEDSEYCGCFTDRIHSCEEWEGVE